MHADGADAVALLQSDIVTLSIYGAYTNWSADWGHVIAAVYYVDVVLRAASRSESFYSRYLQAERPLPRHLTAYARIENSARLQESVYASLFNEHSRDLDVALRRGLAGLRWDYHRHQALNIEASRIVSFERRAFECRLQWTAAIP